MATNGPLQTPVFDDDVKVEVQKRSHVSQPEDRTVRRNVKSKTFLKDGDMLDVLNESDVPVTFRWARRNYTVAPGKQDFVIFEALVNALGDPRSMENSMVRYDDGDGNRGQVMTRYDELTRLMALYGIQKESIDDLVEAAPKVKVYTLQGDQVIFPVTIPDMLPLAVSDVAQNNITHDTRRMIDRVQSENEELRDRLDRMEAAMDAQLKLREGITE